MYMYVIVAPPLCLTYYLSCSLDEICLAFPVLYLDIVGVFFSFYTRSRSWVLRKYWGVVDACSLNKVRQRCSFREVHSVSVVTFNFCTLYFYYSSWLRWFSSEKTSQFLWITCGKVFCIFRNFWLFVSEIYFVYSSFIYWNWKYMNTKFVKSWSFYSSVDRIWCCLSSKYSFRVWMTLVWRLQQIYVLHSYFRNDIVCASRICVRRPIVISPRFVVFDRLCAKFDGQPVWKRLTVNDGYQRYMYLVSPSVDLRFVLSDVC